MSTIPQTAPIPVTLLSGFLGSGKTTLLNHLLASRPDERIAIVENEFGAVGIDGSLLSSRDSVEVIELSNGCVCCSVRGELTEALNDLLTRRDQGELNFNRLLLETTGLADPAPVVQTFFVDDTLRERFQLDAVITLIDAEHAQQQLDEHRVAVAQAGFADRLVLSKLDRIDAECKTLLLDRLRKINARAPILEADHGQLPPEEWIDIQAFNLDDALTVDAAYLPATGNTSSYRTIKRGAPLLARSWSDDITSQIFEGGEMDLEKIGIWMESVIAIHGNDMLRYKGVLAITDESRRLIIQGVHKVTGFDYGADWADDEPRRSLLVVIGRTLPVDELRAGFASCQAVQ